MSILCTLGVHSPAGIPRWNDGFYFARCSRCRADLVRTAYQRWHVPAGYKVVWSVKPPEERPDVAMVEHAADDAGERQRHAVAVDEPIADAANAMPEGPAGLGDPLATLPISVVLAHLRDNGHHGAGAENASESSPDTAVAAAPRRETVGGIAPVAPTVAPRGHGWDFMEEEPEQSFVRQAHGSSAVAGVPGDHRSLVGAAAPSRRRPLTEVGRSVARLSRSLFGPVGRAYHAPGGPHPAWVIGIGLLVSVAIAFGAMLLWVRPAVAPPEPAQPPAAVEPLIGAPIVGAQPNAQRAVGEAAFVSASLLSCHAAPARQAPRVHSLARGTQVDILSREGEWLSIAYRGRQCWALAQYVAKAQPY